ncbi:MAG: glyoxalase [Flavobacteriales bacterium]|nr:glyoxalase [Flavobacteriales bacterium]
MQVPFHLAFPIKSIEETKQFYIDFLGCSLGRESSTWLDINFFGHQLTAQLNPDLVRSFPTLRNKINSYPSYHFGAVLSWEEWHKLESRFIEKNINFIIEPRLVFKGEVGEQKTMFIKDPNGYAIEFKSFEGSDHLFKTKSI